MTFLRILHQVTRWKYFAISSMGVWGIGVTVLLVVYIPWVASYFVSHVVVSEEYFSSDLIYYTELVGGGDDAEPLHQLENPIIYVQIPKRMRISETKSVYVKLEEVINSIGLMSGQRYRTLTYNAALSSPSFQISPSSIFIERSSEHSVDWKWLISPKSIGEHAVLLEFDDDVFAAESTKKYNFSKDRMHITGRSVEGRVEVLTSLGLTAFLDSLMKVVGAVLGILGTVFAYPFWKRFIRRAQ